MDNIEGIKARTEQGIRALMEGLLLAGLTVMILAHAGGGVCGA